MITIDNKHNPIGCPLKGTTHEGYCIDNVAIITVATGECDHKNDCITILEKLERKSWSNISLV